MLLLAGELVPAGDRSFHGEDEAVERLVIGAGRGGYAEVVALEEALTAGLGRELLLGIKGVPCRDYDRRYQLRPLNVTHCRKLTAY